MAYATVSDYLNKYLKGKDGVVPHDDFDFWADKASVIVDRHTFDRLKGVTPPPDEVIAATCALAEKLYNDEASGPALTSESVNGWSGSYKTDSRTPEQQYLSILKEYLANSGLLYRGSYRC